MLRARRNSQQLHPPESIRACAVCDDRPHTLKRAILSAPFRCSVEHNACDEPGGLANRNTRNDADLVLRPTLAFAASRPT